MQFPLVRPEFLTKIVTPVEAVACVASLRQKGAVVFTNGVFDVLHMQLI
jgi:bifunctional ADP-heptose synthase (sugar kinase/adenylyltransferase)